MRLYWNPTPILPPPSLNLNSTMIMPPSGRVSGSSSTRMAICRRLCNLQVLSGAVCESSGDWAWRTRSHITGKHWIASPAWLSIFKTKMAIVSIVGKDRQTFVSEIGLNKDWTDLDVAFCSHTIMGSGEQCMIVPDANRDWRFKKNPFVGEGSGPIQFYAGVPLVVGSGHNTAIIGSLCVIDDKPREFSKDNQSLLRDLAESAVREVSA